MTLNNMKMRLHHLGGDNVQDRMIKDKQKNLQYAIKNSYQAANFKKYPEMNKEFTGLFNAINQIRNSDIEPKMLSTAFGNVNLGDIFYWVNTNSYWICLLQDKTELAYFRGTCRRCNYKVQWVNGERHVLETYLSVIGPRQVDFRTYNPGYGLSIDTPTADLIAFTTNNEQNKKYFNQYQTFVLQGITYKIHQVDTLSLPGIIQMDCVQTYSNLIEDDVEENLKNKWNIQPIKKKLPTDYGIIGEDIIKPLFSYQFSSFGEGEWFVDKKLQKIIKFNKIHHNHIELEWTKPTSGNFILYYKTPDITYEKYIIVESLT